MALSFDDFNERCIHGPRRTALKHCLKKRRWIFVKIHLKYLKSQFLVKKMMTSNLENSYSKVTKIKTKKNFFSASQFSPRIPPIADYAKGT